MRKLLICLAALAVVAIPAVALAQNPAPEVTGSAKITPSKAGTTKKPKAAKFRFSVVNSAASKTTVKRIVVELPKGVKLDGSKLDTCPASTLIAGKTCKSTSKLGTGAAYAFLVTPNPAPDCIANHSAPGCLTFATTFYVGGPKTVTVALVLGGETQPPLTGKISNGGRKLTIDITKELQNPAPGAYSALAQIGGTLSRSKTVKGKKYSFVSTTSCPASKKWTVKSTLHYAANPGAPPVASASSSTDVTCKK